MNYFLSLFSIQILLFCLISLRKSRKEKIILLIISISIIVLFQGLRSYSVGIDLDKEGGYLPFFNYISLKDVISTSGYNFEKGFIILSFLIKSIDNNFTFYLIMISLCIQAPIVFVIYKESKNKPISIIMYLCLGLFTFTFSGLRQSLALAILSISYFQIKDRNLLKFSLLVLLAFTFHKSALVFLPAYFIYPVYKSNNKSFLKMSSIIVVLLVFRKTILRFLLLFIPSRDYVLENNGSFRMIVILFFLWATSWLLSRYRIYFVKNKPVFKIESNKEKLQEITSLSNFIYMALIFQVFAIEVTGFSRMGYYYYIYSILLVPLLLEKIESKKITILICVFIIIGCIVYFKYQTGSGYLNVIPFKFKN